MLTGADYKGHFSKTFSLAYPVMLSQLGQVLVGVADSMMVGRLGAAPLAAASLANSIFFAVLMFGIFYGHHPNGGRRGWRVPVRSLGYLLMAL